MPPAPSPFEEAFNLLEQATNSDSDGDAIPPLGEITLIVRKYNEAISLFKQCLTSGSLEAPVRDLVEQKVHTYEERVKQLVNALPVAEATARLVECTFEEATIPQATLIEDEGWGLVADSKEIDDDEDSVSHRTSSMTSGDEDARELQRRHEQRQEQRRLGNAASLALTIALGNDEKLGARIGPDDGQDELAALKPEAQKVSESYLEAAGLYLESLKVMEASERENNLAAGRSIIAVKRRVEEILDRVDQLKNGKFASSGGGGSSSDASDRPDSAGRRRSGQRSTSPVPTTNLSKQEIEVLKMSSRIGSKIFMPFLESDVKGNKFATLGGAEFEDPDGVLELSSSQKQHFYKWARPSEIAQRQRKRLCMYHTISPYTIKQTLVTDCSFIASLCIAASYERRFRKRVVTGIIYPQNSKGAPLYNDCGKYVVKMWLNGVARRVIIDDRLPVDRNYNLICSHTTNSSYLELWVSLLEKAFLKLTGAQSYAFPGSNSGIDLYSLTGWVPERLFFGDGKGRTQAGMELHETPPERVFQRLHSAFSFGDCLTTASVSPETSEAAADAVGLVTQHAYGILDVREVPSGRFIFMKNPWSSKGWKGRFSPHDSSWTERIGSELGYDYELARRSTDTGLFWICWDDFKHYFTSVHLNWNPSLFKYKFSTHGLWDVSVGPANDRYFVDENPQYVLIPSKEAIEKKATFYILLTRHVDIAEQKGDECNDFLTTFVYGGGGKKIVHPHENVVMNGIFSSNPHVLIRLDASSKHKVLNLVLRQYKKTRTLSYSLSVYCTSNFSFGPLQQKETKSIVGSFSPSGGASGRSGAFYQNPQYSLEVTGSKAVELALTLKTNPSFSVSMSVVKAAGRVDFVARDSEVITSGDYRTAVATCRGVLKPGVKYVLIASTWSAGETGGFVLLCEGGVKVREIKQEADLMPNCYRWGDRWGAQTGVGCANYGSYEQNPRVAFEVGGRGSVFGRLRVGGGMGGKVAINVSVFEMRGDGELSPGASSIGRSCGLVASSNDGVYKSSSGGVTLPSFKVKSGVRYGVVVSTFEPMQGVEFELDLYSDVKFSGVRGGLKKYK